jgi:hypothetical protein
MHHESKKADFIVYRSRNWSLNRISNQIGVGLRTLVNWNRELDDAVHMTRHLHADVHFHNLVEARQKDLEQLTLRQDALDKELAGRDLCDVPTDKLIRLVILSREELLQARSDSVSLAKRVGFIPDLLPAPSQSESTNAPESESAQNPVPTTAPEQLDPPFGAPVPNDVPPDPAPEQTPSAELTQKERTNDAEPAQ